MTDQTAARIVAQGRLSPSDCESVYNDLVVLLYENDPPHALRVEDRVFGTRLAAELETGGFPVEEEHTVIAITTLCRPGIGARCDEYYIADGRRVYRGLYCREIAGTVRLDVPCACPGDAMQERKDKKADEG